MKSFLGRVASILAIVLLSLLGLRLSLLYGDRNRFLSGPYLATAEISLKERRAACLRFRGGDPNDPYYARGDFSCECTYHLGVAAGLYGQQLYPPKDESDMGELCYKWRDNHVKIEKVDADTLRLTTSGETAEEAEDTFKQIMKIYLDRFARQERENGLPEDDLGLPTWSGKAEIIER